MATENLPAGSEIHWYVLNFIRQTISRHETPQRIIGNFNRETPCLELFAPQIVNMTVINGQITRKETPLAFHYVFVKGTFDDVKRLCSQSNGFSFMLDHSSEQRYGMVSDKTMQGFKLIARAHENRLPFFNIEDIDLQEGDEVEVIDGEFAGLRGIFIPRAKSKNGNIVLAASPQHGAIAWDIRAEHIRIIQFAKDSKRQYDQIDAIIPKLYEALRLYAVNESIPTKLLTALTIFSRRMTGAKVNNHKLEAKLAAILIAIQTIIGDTPNLPLSIARYQKRRESVTNPWTLLLLHLLLTITHHPELTKTSASPAPLSSDSLPVCIPNSLSFCIPSPEVKDTEGHKDISDKKEKTSASPDLLSLYIHNSGEEIIETNCSNCLKSIETITGNSGKLTKAQQALLTEYHHHFPTQ